MSEGIQYSGGFVNGRCYTKKAVQAGPPLYYNGDLHFQAHQVGWIVAGTFALISTIVSVWLVNKHLQWYTNPTEQRYIVRLLFMVSIYALTSFASYLFWNHSTPLILIRDCYEGIVVTSFFYLLLAYLSPIPDQQKEIFRLNGLSRENDRQRKRRGLKPRKWLLPLGFIKSKPADGLYFLQIMKWAVLQYCVIRPVTTLAAVILDYVGLYCEASLSPGWGHLYITVIVSISVTIAVYCLIQLYVVISEQLKPHQPLLKLFSLKAVGECSSWHSLRTRCSRMVTVFLTFWQAAGLSVLVTLGLIKDTEYMTAENVSIGIGAILECLEMMMFAFLHVKCFTYKVYVPNPSTIEGDLNDHRTPWLKSLSHAMNPMETFRELRAGIDYMVQRWRGEETDKQARRIAAHQGVFGHSRSMVLSDSPTQSNSLTRAGQEKKREKKAPSPLSQVESGRLDEVLVDVEREIYLGSERQWLGVGNGRDYVLGAVTREKSEGFEDQVVRELYERGYTLREAGKHNKGRSVSRDADVEQGHARGGSSRRSWWQTIYQRVSQSGADDEPEKHLSPHPKRKSVSRTKDPAQALPLIQEMPLGVYVYEDPPPPSALGAYRLSRSNSGQEIPCEGPPRTTLPTPNIVIQSPEPVRPSSNLPVPLGRSDSLLERVFTYLGSDAHATNTDLDHGTESQPSRPTSLWRAGSADVIPKHVEERSSVTQANVCDGVYPRPVTPVRGDVRPDCVPGQDEEPPTPPPRRSHIRERANHSMTPPHSPSPQRLTPVVNDSPVRNHPPAPPVLPLQPPGVPGPSAAYDLSFPLPPLHPRIFCPFPTLDPRSCPPPQQRHPVASRSSPPEFPRRPPAIRNETLIRPFPDPAQHLPPSVGPASIAPPRSKWTIPAPLAQPLPRGSGSLKRNKTDALPPPKQRVLPSGRQHRGPPSSSRRHSQPIPAPRHTTDPNRVPRPPHPSSRTRRASQPLAVLQEASHPNVSPPPSPPQRPPRRLSSPPLSTLPPDKPRRSNAIRRESQSPGTHSPARAMSSRVSLLSELRTAPPLDSADLTRYPSSRLGSGISSPPRRSRTKSPPSPRTPTFVNTHMLPPQTNSPRSDAEEWASAVSSFSPSVKTQRT
ncbi:organic solute transporter Ostalpha-domain-containing protein [Thelephora terrestris]|uniref:Organic solute transporter Ostalpha-domain-containing protein n=1 Tax=Thelephora terrestris TaxID=56493 RepID=A0A9P6HE02_9AGAM|nr:organic solute transporter Ostalpha-domain-containing protein [Thelephora terrestris]